MLENERTNCQSPESSIEKDAPGWIAKNGGLVATHVAVLLFGLVGLFAKVVALPTIILVLGRTFFSSAFLGAYLAVKRQKFALKTRGDYVLIIFAGIILAIHWTSFMQSIQVSTVAVGTLTLATFPLFSAVLEPLLFHEKIRASDIACALVMLGGVGCIVDDFSLEGSMVQGVLWGPLSTFTYALLSLANRKILQRLPRFACIVLRAGHSHRGVSSRFVRA